MMFDPFFNGGPFHDLWPWPWFLHLTLKHWPLPKLFLLKYWLWYQSWPYSIVWNLPRCGQGASTLRLTHGSDTNFWLTPKITRKTNFCFSWKKVLALNGTPHSDQESVVQKFIIAIHICLQKVKWPKYDVRSILQWLSFPWPLTLTMILAPNLEALTFT